MPRSQRPKEPVELPSKSRAVTTAGSFDAPFSPEPGLLQLYYALEARRTSTMPVAVQFISPSTRAGVSIVTSGYARVASEARSEPVLFVDAGCRNLDAVDRMPERPTLVEAFARNNPLSSAIVPARNARNLLWARLSETEGALLSLGLERLRSLMDLLRAEHSLVVMDCASFRSPEAVALSRFCDGSVLVVAAGKTSQRELAAARHQIEAMGGRIVGLVLNRERGAGRGA
ncbi:MAG: hypothetical protein JO227_17815 [Acetobacteraceae bacterium]|nr:hypothetical protein [Acetobacteraceae bacterium]